jgi:hypothetical protein
MNPTLAIQHKPPTPDEYIFALVRSFPCLAIKVRRWLDHTTEFNADEFHGLFDCASTGEVLCALFILNVWNPGYADLKGWNFDLFKFIGCADDGNRKALFNWIARPYWP